MIYKCIDLFDLLPTSMSHHWLIAADWLEEEGLDVTAAAFRESIWNLEKRMFGYGLGSGNGKESDSDLKRGRIYSAGTGLGSGFGNGLGGLIDNLYIDISDHSYSDSDGRGTGGGNGYGQGIGYSWDGRTACYGSVFGCGFGNGCGI